MRDKPLISPKIAPTKSNLKIPTKPQLRPPTKTKTKATQSKTFNLFINLLYFNNTQAPTFLRPAFILIVTPKLNNNNQMCD